MTQTISFFINGHFYYTKTKITLFDLLSYLGYNESLLVLEYNHLICNRKKWNKIFIQDQDKIELITIVGGG